MIFPGDPAVFATFAPRNPHQQVLPMRSCRLTLRFVHPAEDPSA